MKVALGQFAVSRQWQNNAETCIRLMKQAHAGGADLLVLPEGILARDIADPDIVLKTAQALDGPFMTQVLEASRAVEPHHDDLHPRALRRGARLQRARHRA